MPTIHRLARGGAALSLASFLVVSSSRLAADPPSAREVAERWRARQPARLEEIRQRVRDRFGRELPAALLRRLATSTPAAATAAFQAREKFHAGGLAVRELSPLNPLLDPLGLFESEAGEEPPADVVPRLFLADFDGDGDLDAFVGDKYGYVRYLRNDAAPDGEAVYVELTGAASPTGALDLSRDGDGGSPFGPSAPTLVDIDDDGDLDLFVGQGFDDESPAAGGRVLFFENELGVLMRNDAGNPLAGFVFGEEGATPHFVDIDGDDDFDVFVGTKTDDSQPSDGEVFFLENQGDVDSPLFVDRSDVAGEDPFAGFAFAPWSAPFFADIDGDGDLDAFIGDYYGVHFFENQTVLPGPPVFVERTGYDNPLAGTLMIAGAPVVADVDGDGDLDAFVTGGYFKLGFLQYFENTGTAGDSAFLSTGDRIELVDVDGDGDLDALVSVLGPSSADVLLFANLGTVEEPVWELQSGADNPFSTFNGSVVFGPGGSLPSLAPTAGLLDGDGLLDAFVGLPDGSLEFLEDDGTGQLDAAAIHPLEALDFGSDPDPQLVDVDGDGELDLVVGFSVYDEMAEATYSYVAFFLNTPGPDGIDATPELVLDVSDLVERPAPTLADVDGDGDLDLYLGGLYGYGGVYFLENTAAPGGLAFDVLAATPLEVVVGPPATPALGDVNGDGVLDLFLGSTKGVEMFLSTSAELEVTKAVTGGDLAAGGTVEYTLTIENVGTATSPDDPGSSELVDTLPAELVLTSAMVTGGPGSAAADAMTNTVTFDGAIAPGEVVTILVTADVAPGTEGQTVVNQAFAAYDSDEDTVNDANEPSDDPTTPADDDATAFVVVGPPLLEVTKEVTGGDLMAGGTVEYTVTIENVGFGDQPDAPAAPELTDVLPPELTPLTATVTSGPGTATVDAGTNTVRYDGAIAAGETVVLVITASIDSAEETTVVNQAVAFYDADRDGTNDTEEPSDDPSTPAEDDATAFLSTVLPTVLEIPTLSQWGAALFGALLSLAGALGLRRRRTDRS